MNKYVLLLTSALILPIAFFLISQQSKQKNTDTLRVGMFPWAPFMSINPQGTYEGFDVDVAQELAKRLNKKLIIQDFGSLASCFIALEQKKIDLLMSDLDITEQRLNKINMVQYTGENVTSFKLVFWKQVPQEVICIEDLKNIPTSEVCAEPGSAQEKFLDSLPYITKKPMSNAIEGLLNIRYGKATAMILEPSIALGLQQKNPELVLLDIPLPKAFQVLGCGIGIKKNNDAITTLVMQTIATMKADGTMAALEKKWNVSC